MLIMCMPCMDCNTECYPFLNNNLKYYQLETFTIGFTRVLASLVVAVGGVCVCVCGGGGGGGGWGWGGVHACVLWFLSFSLSLLLLFDYLWYI